PHEHLVLLGRDGEHRRDLVPQRRGRARAQIALEIDDEDARLRVDVARLLAVSRATFLHELLEPGLAVHGAPEHVGLLLELAVQVSDDDRVRRLAAPAERDERGAREQQQGEDRDELRDEERVFAEELAHYSPTLLCSKTRSAR